MDKNYCILLNGGEKSAHTYENQRSNRRIQNEHRWIISKNGYRNIKAIQELPADEILLHEAILIANALDKKVVDLYEF